MTSLLFRWLALLALLLSGPLAVWGGVRVAVCDFQTDGNIDAQIEVKNAGSSLANLVAADLSDLPPFSAINGAATRQLLGDQAGDLMGPISADQARRIGQAAQVAALVNGRIYAAGPDLIIATKVVAVATGQTLGTMVKGPRTASLADLISQLSAQIGKIVLTQQGLASPPWDPATIVGTGKPGSLFTHGEIACVMAIDGAAIADETQHWRQMQTLPPGRHQIAVRYANRTMLDYSFVFDARPGLAYEVAYAPQPQQRVRLWIQEQTSRHPVTPIVEGTLPGMASTYEYLYPQFERPDLPTYH